ncbi:hypothetical protein [Xanthomonas citri]|uniref:hypothetical protein n=1 Tax=Xanthomonas citri TaxID=346 RepID=UPI001CBBEF33|nr:hypothetical protein [Xanthomonas citri]MBZ3928694.1 hypothetical protein [Xanthomonas citri pv. thirumalacharii]
MRPTSVGILGLGYVLGEQSLPVAEIAGRAEVMREYRMPDRQALWGWDRYRRTERSRADLASESAAGTVVRGGVAPGQIDALVVCCGDGLNYSAQNVFVSELSKRLGLDCGFVTWIGGAGCASLFSAVRVARSLVMADTFRNVLVVGVDKVDNEAARFQRYGVFSDSACSFIVRGEGPTDFTVAGVAVASSLPSLNGSGQDIAQKCMLIQSVFERLGSEKGEFPYEGSVFFGSNVFLPIQDLERSVMPIDGVVHERGNIAPYGHCADADPFINLFDFYARGDNENMARSVLGSSAHGHFGVMLLDRRPTTTG